MIHKKQWEFLKRKFGQDQLSHAYLFSGIKNLGKMRFAKEFAEFIGCKFPDLMVIDSEGAEISIAKIRDIQNFLAYKSYNTGFKTVIVRQAHLMNQEAQNCFLKTLEEPKGKTLIILISSKPEMLLPTISSRCQPLKFFGKPEITAEEKEEENKILKEITAIMNADLSEKFKYAKSLDFEKQSLGQILEVLEKYFRGQMLEGSLNSRRVLQLIGEINHKITTTNASPKLALEVLLMQI